MIQRHCVRCDVCKTHHTLRIQMGYGEQYHRFQCHHCGEPITIELPSERNGERAVLIGASSSGPADETSYQYLSPDFVADEKDAKNPRYFGAFDILDKLMESPSLQQAIAGDTDPEYHNTSKWFALSDAPSDWDVLQRCWRLERSGRSHLAAKQLEAFADRNDFESISTWLAVATFTERLFHANDELLSSVIQIKQRFPSEFDRLVIAYEYEWKTELRDGQFQVFSEFFKRWVAFSQVYLYVSNGVKMPTIPTATPIDFEGVRGFYALAQEFFAKQVVLLTALNNIKAGRQFDELQHISLNKYWNTDNARRRDNFASNQIFNAVSAEYDSGLRNAVAHNWITLRPDGKTLYYKQGGRGVEVRLAYTSYLFKCMSLFKQICMLIQVEYLLTEAARAAARALLGPTEDKQ